MTDQPQCTRRDFLKSAAGAALAATQPLGAYGTELPRPKTILLYSGWQTVNIGDIGHTPGVLTLVQRHIPEAQVILWPAGRLDRGVDPMLRKAFPKVRIVGGAAGDPSPDEAAREADLLLYGSGPSINISRLEQWRKDTGKPYGSYGNTFDSIDDRAKSVLSEAAFVFTRETKTLERLREAGVSTPTLEFAPDGTFGIDLVDEDRATDYLNRHQLREGEFICAIPRLRRTPYYKLGRRGWSEERIRETEALNAKWAEPDHAKTREAMIRWVRETGHKVFVCPEMTYQLDIMDELLIDPLPADVKSHVVRRREYWLPDEAASIYKRARAVLSSECHSPIIAFACGTPAFYLRQPQDTIKGQMWYDIGVKDWVFEIEESTGRDIADRLMTVHQRYDDAKDYLNRAMDIVRERQRASMTVVRKAMGFG